jgi:hypothetical protein
MQRLRVEEIMTVGFVEKGDDPEAEIVFFKRRPDEQKRGSMDKFKNFLKTLGLRVGMSEEEVEGLLADEAEGGSENDGGLNPDNGDSHMTFDVNKLDDEQRNAFDQAVEAAVEARLAKGTEEEELPEDMPETVQKAFDDVQKRLEAAEDRAKEAEGRVVAMDERREREAYIQKAQSLGLPGAPADDFAEILRKAQGALTDEERDKMDEILNASANAIREGDLLKEVGNGGRGPTSVEGEVETLAKALMEKDPAMTREAAEGQVWKDRPDLYTRYRNERPTTNRGD